MKHVSATTTNSEQIQTDMALDMENAPSSTNISTPTSKGKQNFHDIAIQIFEKMAKTSTCLMKNFEKANKLLKRVDYQFDHLINML